ncbi:SGNH/GDSL hydrolase family protein [Muricauda sp. 2012CJ35-5]|uniref:SGNH/GDSL hydrolase family protein n=1 Tax=Flagellimonas spongiicola TaxID=2942208 RepID=A0ABT0PSS5_9FLAO|nr:SGNH/GDSL hydrolase family protein [Allomuricauda spongiicola]MCL6273508.1 SGNH/GDSL hydrolase family protein [Allomuricauda spongiicola]
MPKNRILILILISSLSFSNYSIGQDWANLGKYQEENQILLKTEMDANRIVFMGNSITEGWPVGMPSFFENPSFVNRGISGQTTPQMLLRFRQDVLALNPKAVIILAGTNDIAGNTGPITLEQITGNIKSMVELALANNIKPIICSVVPAFDYPWKAGMQPNIKIPLLNQMLKNLAIEKKVPYLDYFSRMADERNGLSKDLAEDGVHPTPKGYEIMAKAAMETINKL